MTQPPNHPGEDEGGFPPPYPNQPGYPPPPGAYPPPQQGWQGYPPAPGGYGAPYGRPQGFGLGNAFEWAWNKFTKNAVALIVPLVVYGIALIALSVLAFWLSGALGLYSAEPDDANIVLLEAAGGGPAVVALAMLPVGILGYIAQAAYISGALDIADGEPVGVGSFFKPRNAGQVVIAALIIGVVSALISLIPFAGTILSLVLGFVTFFALPVIVDRGVSAVEGFTQGFALIRRDPGNSIVVFVISALVVLAGAMICLVGMLVAAPVAVLLVINAYRLISGGQVAPIAR